MWGGSIYAYRALLGSGHHHRECPAQAVGVGFAADAPETAEALMPQTIEGACPLPRLSFPCPQSTLWGSPGSSPNKGAGISYAQTIVYEGSITMPASS